MKSICVYCASSLGKHPIYAEVAEELGETLASYGIKTIYGGAKVGIMGKLADGVISAKGEIVGIIPEFLKTKEIAHDELTELITVENMHERKALMQEMSEGFITLPGGFGTMEELFEILTWGQIGLHKKPIGILNINGYYDSLIQLVDKMVEEGLLNEKHREIILVSDSVEDLISQMNLYQVPFVSILEGAKVM